MLIGSGYLMALVFLYTSHEGTMLSRVCQLRMLLTLITATVAARDWKRRSVVP